jgi:hypothetical protein
VPVDDLHGLEPQARAVTEDELLDDVSGRLGLDRRLEQPARGAAATAQAVAEASACADAVYQHRVLGDEVSAATAGEDEVLGGERGDGLADGVAVHAEALGEISLGRKLRTGRPLAAHDFAAQLLGDEPPGGVPAPGSALRRHLFRTPAASTCGLVSRVFTSRCVDRESQRLPLPQVLA